MACRAGMLGVPTVEIWPVSEPGEEHELMYDCDFTISKVLRAISKQTFGFCDVILMKFKINDCQF